MAMQIRATNVYPPVSINGSVTAVRAQATSQAGMPGVFSQGAGTPSPGLFFTLPNVSTTTKKMMAHYFYYPISLDDATPSQDYYANGFLAPNGEGGVHAATGGMFRNRPKPRQPLGGDWQLTDAKTDIANARSVGIDGFFCDMLWMDPNSNAGWPMLRYLKLRDAAVDTPGFLVVPMFDCNAGAVDVNNLANLIKPYFGRASTWMDGGKMIVGGYGTENNTPAWWSSLATACLNAGITGGVKFVHAFNGGALSGYPDVYAAGSWGPGTDPAFISSGSGTDPATVRAQGIKYLGPVWLQDVRVSSFWSEALNTKALTASWDRVILDNADVVQLCTWGDFSEGSEFMDTASCGRVACDISAYYAARWKTGAYPQILRDALYLSYRNHVSGAPIRGPQTQFMWKRGPTAMAYNVEALVFLTAPATVTITVAGQSTNFNAVAGMSRFTVPAAAGSVSAKVTRGGTDTASVSPSVVIRPDLWVECRHYFMFGSIRGTAGYFDPTYQSNGQPPVYP